MAWLLGLVPVIGAAALIKALFNLLRAPGDHRRKGHYRLVAVTSLLVLAGSSWLGWPGPFGGLGFSRGVTPNLPRDELGTHELWLDVARAAVGPSNRSMEPRVQPSPTPQDTGGGAEKITLIVRANDAGNTDQLRRDIRGDSWAIFRAIFEDNRLDWIQEVRLIFTHPQGSIRTGNGEPPVAQIRLTREQFQRLNPPGVNPDRLDDIAEVRWLPPLSGS